MNMLVILGNLLLTFYFWLSFNKQQNLNIYFRISYEITDWKNVNNGAEEISSTSSPGFLVFYDKH